MLAQLYHNYIFCCMTDLWLFWIWFSRGSYQAKSESDTSHPKKKKHFFKEKSNLEPGLIANEAGALKGQYHCFDQGVQRHPRQVNS